MRPEVGLDLGRRRVSYDEDDVILYALAVGAVETELSLVFEQQLQVLPTFALTLAQWAPDVLAGLGAWDVSSALHGMQRLRVLRPMPPAGELELSARVTGVWDKGTAAVYDITVSSDYFEATWSIFAPGYGGFGGERGPSAPASPEREPDRTLELQTYRTQAVLYRLTGDRHRIHVDPDAARAIGAGRPILHGLCTLAASTLAIARAVDADPAALLELHGRFAAPVLPGERLDLRLWHDGDAICFDAVRDGRPVLTAGRVRFG